MDWFFRGRFRNNRSHDPFMEANDDAEDVTENESGKDSFDMPINDPFEMLEDTSLDLFQRMDDMLNRVFSASFAGLDSENFSEHAQSESNPRAIMLKDPDYGSCEVCPNELPFETKQPSVLIDSDIDDKVAKNRWMLKESPLKNAQPSFSYKRFSSIKTVRLPDGTLEEHHSVTDSQGNTTTTVRRSIGDQSHEVITHSDEEGLKEKVENFTNLDEGDLHSFENKWKSITKEGNPVPALDLKSNASEPKLNAPAGDPSYLSLFKKFFGV